MTFRRQSISRLSAPRPPRSKMHMMWLWAFTSPGMSAMPSPSTTRAEPAFILDAEISAIRPSSTNTDARAMTSRLSFWVRTQAFSTTKRPVMEKPSVGVSPRIR